MNFLGEVDMGQILLVAVLLVALGAVLIGSWGTRRLQMAIEMPLIATRVDLDSLVFERLCTVKGAAVVDSARGRFTQSIQRIPTWAVVAMIVTFPVGLLFLLVHSPRDLHLAIVPDREGEDVLRVTGVTEVHVWRRTCRALAPLLAPPEDAEESVSGPRPR